MCGPARKGRMTDARYLGRVQTESIRMDRVGSALLVRVDSHREVEADFFFARRVVPVEKLCPAPARARLATRRACEQLRQQELDAVARPCMNIELLQAPTAPRYIIPSFAFSCCQTVC